MGRDLKFRQWYDGQMRILDQVMFGVGQMGFSDTHWIDLGSYDVEAGEIMQFTGMLDRNGAEIWEHDIVKAPDGRHWEVVYYGDRFMLRDDKPGGVITVAYAINQCEVVGNIHESAELVK